MVDVTRSFGAILRPSSPDRGLACAPIHSEVGERYLGAMRAAAAAIVDGTLEGGHEQARGKMVVKR